MYHSLPPVPPAPVALRPTARCRSRVGGVLTTTVLLAAVACVALRGAVDGKLGSAAMEVADAVRGAPMTRTMDNGPLRVSTKTDALKLRGAISARLAQEGVAELQAVGMMAIGTALKV